MADTNAIDPGTVVQGAAPAGGPTPLARVQQIGTPQVDAPAGQVSGLRPETLNALTKLGSDILAPRIQAAAQEQFLSGVQRAAAGEAVKDIVDSRPWYSEIFGPSAAVQGARAYTTAEKVARFGADIAGRMPELAQSGPEALSGAITGLTKELMTGDAATDAAIMSQVTEQMAPLYKQHAKERYVYLQRQAVDAQGKYWAQEGRGLQAKLMSAARGDGTITQADAKAAVDNFFGGMSPFPGQSDDSYEKSQAYFLQNQAEQGNYHVIAAYEKAGLMSKLPADVQAKLSASLRADAGRALSRVIADVPGFAEKLVRYSADMTQDPRKIPELAAKLNAEAAALTGVDQKYGQLIAPGSIDNTMAQVAKAQATAMAKEQKQALEFAKGTAALTMPGALRTLVDAGTLESDAAKQAVMAAWSAGTPEQRAHLLQNTHGVKVQAIADRFSDALRVDKPTVDSLAMVQTWATLKEDDPAKAYVDAKTAAAYEYLASQTRNGGVQDPARLEAAWAGLKAGLATKDIIDPQDKNARDKTVRSWVEDRRENMFGWNLTDDRGLAIMGQLVNHQLKDRGTQQIEPAVRIALQRVTSDGTGQFLGRKVVIMPGGYKNGRPFIGPQGLWARGQTDHAAAGEAFDELVDDWMKQMKGDKFTYTIFRQPDVGDETTFLLTASTDDGTPLPVKRITSQEIRAKAGAKRVAVPVPGSNRLADPATEDHEAWMRQRQADLNPVRR